MGGKVSTVHFLNIKHLELHFCSIYRSELTWVSPPLSCAASCPSAPPAARAPPHCPSVLSDQAFDPWLTPHQLSQPHQLNNQLVVFIWKREKIVRPNKIHKIQTKTPDSDKVPRIPEFTAGWFSANWWRKRNIFTKEGVLHYFIVLYSYIY